VTAAQAPNSLFNPTNKIVGVIDDAGGTKDALRDLNAAA
jgi:hypothetical protein